MAHSEKELEKHLLEAGNVLLSPPSSVNDLLNLLDRIETYLTRVEQSPSDSMKKALSPSMKALIADDLLKHSDIDVKVAVAACISEITRITAPDAPYEDDQMKEVFQLIVSSFANLDDKSSISYVKRTCILETVAKVRSCVVMLDLECDGLIVEMFQHFFRSIRDDHPESVFSSMETIMTLVLEESEDISIDLLSSILDFLKRENQEVLPIARKLGEKVIEKCASKLKPYLLPAVKSRGASLDDYSKVVVNICETEPEAVEPGDGDAARKNLADGSDLVNPPQEKAVEVTIGTLDDAPPSEEVGPTTVASPKSVMSNGSLQKEIDDTPAGNDDSKEADHDTHYQVKADVEPEKTSADAKEPEKSHSKPEKSNRRKGRKTIPLKSSSEPSDPSLTDDIKEAVKVSDFQEKDGKNVDNALSEEPVADAAEPSENEKECNPPASSPKTSDNDPAHASSPSMSETLADEIRSKKAGRGKKKDETAQQSEPVRDVDSKKESDTKKTVEETGILESKSHKRSGKKLSTGQSGLDKDDKISSPVDTSKKEDESTSELDAKLPKQLGKKAEVGSNQNEDKKKKGQVKATPSKGLGKTPPKDSGKPVAKSAGKSTKDESDVDKASTSSKRKRNQSEGKAPGTKPYGEEMVGKRVKVWWPDDKKYYKGTVKLFDPKKKKHTVSYDDGDVEVLTLAEEKFEILKDEPKADQGNASDGESPDESSEVPKGKKAKTESSGKKGGASSSKSKATPKSGRKDGKAEGKSKEEVSKKGGKSDEDKGGKSKDLKSGNKSSDAPKAAGKSKGYDAETSKSSSKSKVETPKGGAKSKGKSPKVGSKSNTNGTDKAKTTPSKDEEDDDDEMTPEPAKAPETAAKGKSPSTSKSQKSPKKRKRGSKS